MNNAIASLHVEEFLDKRAEEFGLPKLPKPTPSRAYVVARLLSFGKPNQRHDGFRFADVDDAVVNSLAGAALIANRQLDDHTDADGAKVQLGSVVAAVKNPDGVYLTAAVDKDMLRDKYNLDPSQLSTLSVSMECKFASDEAEYEVNGNTLTRTKALTAGIAHADAQRDNPAKYFVRWLKPVEFPRVALLRRGKQADANADVLQAVAAKGKGKKGKVIFDFTGEKEKSVDELRELVNDLMARSAAENTTIAQAAADKEILITGRIGELEKWRPLGDEERKVVRAIASTTDTLEWMQYTVSWYKQTLADFRAAEARAARSNVPPTLTANPRRRLDPFDFTED